MGIEGPGSRIVTADQASRGLKEMERHLTCNSSSEKS